MIVGLLDVNVLIALTWPSHVHHRFAHRWFAENHVHGWATCPLTQSAFVRISSNPRIIPEAVTPGAALELLQKIVTLDHHVFWSDDIPFHLEVIPRELIISHRQITDAYLLGLSIRNQGKLVTLDRGVVALLPKGSPYNDALEFLPTND